VIRWPNYFLIMGVDTVDRCIAGITIKSTFLAQPVVEFLI
jgi:hypothetical protein